MAVIQTAQAFTPAELPRITDVDRADLTTGITHLLSRKGYISLTGATKLGKTTFVRSYLASLPEGSWSTYIPGQSLKNGATDLWLRLAQELEIPTSKESGLGRVSYLRWWPKRIRLGKWIGRSALTPRSTVPTNTPRTRRAPTRTRGASSNYKNSPLGEDEPAGHGIGRSRGGLTTKIHQVVDGNGRPLAMVVTGGQRNDGAMMQDTLKDIYVPRPTGRPRTTPDTVMADRGYT